jgi:hypothetical protein
VAGPPGRLPGPGRRRHAPASWRRSASTWSARASRAARDPSLSMTWCARGRLAGGVHLGVEDRAGLVGRQAAALHESASAAHPAGRPPARCGPPASSSPASKSRGISLTTRRCPSGPGPPPRRSGVGRCGGAGSASSRARASGSAKTVARSPGRSSSPALSSTASPKIHDLREPLGPRLHGLGGPGRRRSRPVPLPRPRAGPRWTSPRPRCPVRPTWSGAGPCGPCGPASVGPRRRVRLRRVSRPAGPSTLAAPVPESAHHDGGQRRPARKSSAHPVPMSPLAACQLAPARMPTEV